MKTILLCAMLIFSTVPAAAGPPSPPPAGPDGDLPALAAPVRLFQRYLSGADGHRCPMTPSCSSYAVEAMRRHGALVGWIMASDRLMRCGRDELRRSPAILTPNGIRSSDPVGANDFWWR